MPIFPSPNRPPYPFPVAPAVDVYVSESADGPDPPTWISRISASTGVVTHWGADYGFGLAVDGLGNAFVAGAPGVRGLRKVPTEGGEQSVVGPADSGGAVTVDPGGNAYTIDNSNQVWKIPPGNQPYSVVWASSGQLVWSLAADAASNLYVMLHNPTTVVRIPADGGSPTVLNLGGIFATETPWAFAVDPQGQYAYMADGSWPSTAVKVQLTSGAHTDIGPQINVFGLDAIAADAYGNVYIADQLGDRVVMVYPSGDWATIYKSYSPSAVAVQLAHIPHWRPPEQIGKLLGEIAADGGGWIVIGNQFVPIPPRSPSVLLLARAALPYLGQVIENRELGSQIRHMR